MLVSELIKKLRAMPQDAKVIMTTEYKGTFDNEVRDVIYNDTKVKEDQHTVELDNWPPVF